MNANGMLGFLSAEDLPTGCVEDSLGVTNTPRAIVECFVTEYAALFEGKNGSVAETSFV